MVVWLAVYQKDGSSSLSPGADDFALAEGETPKHGRHGDVVLIGKTRLSHCRVRGSIPLISTHAGGTTCVSTCRHLGPWYSWEHASLAGMSRRFDSGGIHQWGSGKPW